MYQMKNPGAIDALEHLARSLEFMTPELEQYIQEQRKRFIPKTSAELRQSFDAMRRHTYSINEMMRGMDDYYADQQEELRRHLLEQHPQVMGDYLMEYGQLRFSGQQSDVWSYPLPYEDVELFYEVWLEYTNQGVLVRCRRLESGTCTLRCGTSYEVPNAG